MLTRVQVFDPYPAIPFLFLPYFPPRRGGFGDSLSPTWEILLPPNLQLAVSNGFFKGTLRAPLTSEFSEFGKSKGAPVDIQPQICFLNAVTLAPFEVDNHFATISNAASPQKMGNQRKWTAAFQIPRSWVEPNALFWLFFIYSPFKCLHLWGGYDYSHSCS